MPSQNDLTHLKSQIESVLNTLDGIDLVQPPGILVDELRQGFDQVFSAAQSIETSPEHIESIISQSEQSFEQTFSEFIMTLLGGLEDYLAYEQIQQFLPELVLEIDEIIINVAIWCNSVCRNLKNIEPLVNAFSRTANQTHESQHLASLYQIMESIAENVDDTLRQDMDTSNPGRPWRVLNLNMGIVATRSHDPEIIEIAYEKLLHRLPVDAADFFHEGMQQMDIVGYPDHVRNIVEKYHTLTSKKTLH